MTKQMKSSTGIEQIPEGYKLEYGYVIPKEWKIVRFDKCFHRLTQKNAENNQNVLTISAQQGLISQLDYYNTLYASEDKTGYFLLQKGDFAYNKSYSTDYAYGAIKQLEKYEKGIVSPLYICFSANQDTNTDFYRQYFEAGRFNREIYKIAQEGARNHGLLNVSTPEFFSAALVYPPVAEQKKIAEILAQCDKVIELKQQRLEAEVERKKWLMNQLLHHPEKYRVPGFYGNWENATIGSITSSFSGGTPTSSNSCYYSHQGIPFIRSGEIGESKTELYLSDQGFANSAAKMVKKGDLLYALYGANSGECFISKIDGAINQAILCIRSETIDIRFLYYVLASMKEWIVATYLQGGQGNLSGAIIKKLKISYPQKDEQQAIVKIIYSQDIVIDKLREELKKLEEHKKALMQLLLAGIVRVSI